MNEIDLAKEILLRSGFLLNRSQLVNSVEDELFTIYSEFDGGLVNERSEEPVRYQKIIQTVPETKAVWSELISYNPTVKPGTNEWGPLNSSNQGTTFKLNALYLDERTNRYYRWTSASGYLGQLFAINNPGGTTEYYRFVFASLNYFKSFSFFYIFIPFLWFCLEN
jgi:hypothetical protein